MIKLKNQIKQTTEKKNAKTNEEYIQILLAKTKLLNKANTDKINHLARRIEIPRL